MKFAIQLFRASLGLACEFAAIAAFVGVGIILSVAYRVVTLPTYLARRMRAVGEPRTTNHDQRP